MSALDCAREALSAANTAVIQAENSADPEELVRALVARDRAEAHLARVEEVDNHIKGANRG
jgi:hypothetical protein